MTSIYDVFYKETDIPTDVIKLILHYLKCDLCDNTADDIRHNSPESIILNEKDVVANKVDVDALAQLFMNGDEIVACPSKTCPT